MARLPLLMIATMLMVGGCGERTPAESTTSPLEAPDASVSESDPEARRGTSEVLRDLLTPKGVDETEGRLVREFADAIASRDFEAMTRLTTAELAADLGRMHAEDAAGFWRRGRIWVDNVATGVSTAHREPPEKGRWRALLRFGNGVEETVVFVRQRGMLRFEQL